MMKFKEFITENKSDLKKIEKELSKWPEDAIFGLNDDLWGESDDSDARDEWNNSKNDLDKSDLISIALEMMEEMETTYKEFQDFKSLYNESLKESYNKEFGAMYVKAKESKDIEQIHENSDFIIQFKFNGTEYEYTLKDSSTKGIEKVFAKILNKNVIPSAIDGDTNEIKNTKLSDCTNFRYKIN